MIRLHRLRRWESLVLMLAAGATSGCINSDKFTSGRLPYGGGGQLAATSPRDPFLTGRSKQPSETNVAAAAPAAQPTSYGAPSNAPYYAAVQGAAPPTSAYAMPAGAPQSPRYATSPGAPQAPQYAMAASAPVADMRQVAYTPSADNPFNAPPSAQAAKQPMPPQMQSYPSSAPIEQISYEMPAGSSSEANPFAEVEGAPSVSYQQTAPQIQPMNGAMDPWQPSADSSGGFAGDGFLPPQ